MDHEDYVELYKTILLYQYLKTKEYPHWFSKPVLYTAQREWLAL